ncbi:MAG: carbohydrate kinase, partial [Candidatus Dormibacteraeota bacterium]|nr:carbohydrate kinase [Candidatus Dormibacteraeota bacterium]
MSELLLAIDVGTSITKAAALDADGNCVAVARELTPVRYPAPDRAESDPDCWWPQAARCVREVLERGVDAGRIVAVGVSGFMHTL